MSALPAEAQAYILRLEGETAAQDQVREALEDQLAKPNQEENRLESLMARGGGVFHKLVEERRALTAVVERQQQQEETQWLQQVRRYLLGLLGEYMFLFVRTWVFVGE
ncbi:hypothetical protein B0J11DRAFT_576559 [Dendryphion nanum]|uniref:HTH Mu-type domain-containing protein n=1 Tax=Dendryphion nanum TaxID=256645 RepID=A0A9P9IUK2_9PLEO|nr:hypothetical protein B0J11DRAFT_576559 [Dendryphion nanum]